MLDRVTQPGALGGRSRAWGTEARRPKSTQSRSDPPSFRLPGTLPTCPLPTPNPFLGAVQTLSLVAFQSYFRERSMHGLESRYPAGLSMLRILSTRSPGDGAELVQVG